MCERLSRILYIERNCSQSLKIYTNSFNISVGDASIVFAATEIKNSMGFKFNELAYVNLYQLSWHYSRVWIFDLLETTIFTESICVLHAFMHVVKHSRNLLFEILKAYAMISGSGPFLFCVST